MNQQLNKLFWRLNVKFGRYALHWQIELIWMLLEKAKLPVHDGKAPPLVQRTTGRKMIDASHKQNGSWSQWNSPSTTSFFFSSTITSIMFWKTGIKLYIPFGYHFFWKKNSTIVRYISDCTWRKPQALTQSAIKFHLHKSFNFESDQYHTSHSLSNVLHGPQQ